MNTDGRREGGREGGREGKGTYYNVYLFME